FGIDEKVRLWEWYREQIEIPDVADVRIMRLDVRGDMAWLGCEGVTPIRPVGASGTGSETWQIDEGDGTLFRFRSTEVYVRDDGEGNPVWKMWHFHCSPLPPEDEVRPAFDDTGRQRGLGGTPAGEPERVAGV